MTQLGPDVAAQDLGRATARSGAIVLGSMVLQKLLTLGILAVLARLLTPADYGLLGMVLAIIALLQVFADLGLSMATVQRAELTRAQVSTLFWINAAFGLVLCGAAMASAHAIAWFFGEPRLVALAGYLALGFALAGLGVQHEALLVRRMRFGRIAACEIVGLIAGGATGIALALTGYGVLALVGQQLALIAARTIALWTVSGFLPGLPSLDSGVGQMLSFGGFHAGHNLINALARSMDRILLGRFWGPAALGLYTRAHTLMMLPVTAASYPAARVIVPALSRLQHDPEAMQRTYLRFLRLLGFLTFPVMALMLAASDEVVAVLYGPRWAEAAPILMLLCIAGLWQAIYSVAGVSWIAAGRTDRQFLAGVLRTPVLIAGMVIGLQWGARGVALGYSIALAVVVVPELWYAFATINIGLGRGLRNLAAPAVCALPIIPVVWILKQQLTALPAILLLAVSAAVAAIVFFGIGLVGFTQSFREARAQAAILWSAPHD